MTTPEPVGDYDPTGYEEDLDEQIRKVEESRHVDKRQKWWLFGLFIFTLLLAIAVGFLLVQSWQETERERATTATVQEEKQEIAEEAQKALCGTAEREIYDRELCAKWTELAKTPAPKVEIVDVDREEIVDAFRAYCEQGNCRGANGRTPTAEEVAAAFARFCADGNCRGEDGADGQDAPPPVNGVDGQDGAPGKDGADATPEMVLAAVTSYCAEGACVGPAGADGQPGPPPSDEAIAEAVAAFCSTGACTGPQGEPGQTGATGATGQTGATGADGRGITSIECQQEPEYAWIVTYTDGTIVPVPGPCRVAEPGPPIDVVPGPPAP